MVPFFFALCSHSFLLLLQRVGRAVVLGGHVTGMVGLHGNLSVGLGNTTTRRLISIGRPKFCSLIPSSCANVAPGIIIGRRRCIVTKKPLFVSGGRPRLGFISPIDNMIADIRHNTHHGILGVIMRTTARRSCRRFNGVSPSGVDNRRMGRTLLRTNVFTFVHRHPCSIVTSPAMAPGTVFVSTFSDGPLTPSFRFTLGKRRTGFRAKLSTLSGVTGACLNVDMGRGSTTLIRTGGIAMATFSKPRPTNGINMRVGRVSPMIGDRAI